VRLLLQSGLRLSGGEKSEHFFAVVSSLEALAHAVRSAYRKHPLSSPQAQQARQA
jgi:hypothetical protein